MASGTYLGIPREKIPWYPTIDADLCTNCGSCIEFCANDVFSLEEDTVSVSNPYNCVVGCSACTTACPVEAISFPSVEELKSTLARLREESSRN